MAPRRKEPEDERPNRERFNARLRGQVREPPLTRDDDGVLVLRVHTAGGPGGNRPHVVWEEVVGTAREKWLLWTGERIDAQIALQWGVVSEVVARERVLERGVEIARSLAAKPPLYRTLQKQTLNLNLRRGIVQNVPFAMALEGLAAADLAC
jgi:enoyl-CoA hydratase/isomerase-like protein